MGRLEVVRTALVALLLVSCTGKGKVGDVRMAEIAETSQADGRGAEPGCIAGENACFDDQACTCVVSSWSCETCPTPEQRCVDGECCTPDCDYDRACGSDGCGGSCGECGPHSICDEIFGTCGLVCSEELFSDELCGKGEDVKRECGICASSHEAFECVLHEGEDDDLIITTCRCEGWGFDEPFRCNWVRPIPGQILCQAEEDCPSPGSDDGESEPMACLTPCERHAAPFCAAQCMTYLDCPPGHYCDAHASSDHGHCIPNGHWSCGKQCWWWPSSLQCACSSDEDCQENYGLCIPGPHGSFCAPTYDEGGCGGFELEYIYWPGCQPEMCFVCADLEMYLCQPCVTSEECKLPWSENFRGDSCVSYGEEGSFCAIPCGSWRYDDAECPFGYECADGLCVSKTGSCNCPPHHVDIEATTFCHLTNEHGSCSGPRVCTPEGLSDCNAKLPVPETCDGHDNDCDGEIDEGCE